MDSAINEYYLWHGCKPEAAEGITDANFDLKRDLTLSGHVFCLNDFATQNQRDYTVSIYWL